ncbi:class I SAM-dependent methyltransferase [Mycobacterium rufum]|uniref:Class I SAM-dependent methyltransferase n=1 Tax=Mycolicibacterium rufum TaxID=318424 RepID=A0A9X3BIW6_9MYCO|nr:class I SAM-dependent methyltransferase [Mycolicibacterium rufum]
MIGALYEAALTGQRCWVRGADYQTRVLPVDRWLADCDDDPVDAALAARAEGPTVDLACGPGRFAAWLARRGVPAVGIDQSAVAVHLAEQRGARALRGDVFDMLPREGWWQTVLLADGNVGIGADPLRLFNRCRALLREGGHCVVEFDPSVTGASTTMLRLETDDEVGPWFEWASVGLDAVEEFGQRVSLRLKDVEIIGERGMAELAAI